MSVSLSSVRSRMVGVSAGMSVLSFSDVYLAVVVTGYVAVMFGPVSAGVVAAFAGVPWLFLSGYGGRIADRLTVRRIRKVSIIANACAVAVVGVAVMMLGSVLETASSGVVTVLWGLVVMTLGCLETVRNSLARVALMDMDPSGGSKTWFARIDRASYMVGLSLGGVAAAVFPTVIPVFLGVFLIVTAAIAVGMFLWAMPHERVSGVELAVRKHRRGLGLVPPRHLPRELVEALWVLAVVGFFCIQNVAMFPMTAAVFPYDGLLGWMRVASAVAGMGVLILKFSTERQMLKTVVRSGFGMVGMCGVFAVATLCYVTYGWVIAGVCLVIVASALSGGLIGLLLTGTRQLGAVLSPKDTVGEVTGWTSLPANGFAVLTGPLVGIAVLQVGVGWVWGFLAVAAFLGLVLLLVWRGKATEVSSESLR